MALSNYAENKLLDHILGTAAFTMPTQVYVALFTADNGLESGVLTGEVSGGSYARVAVDFSAASGGVANPTATVTFPQATGSWGTVTHVALMDAPSGGNVLLHGPLTQAKSVTAGQTAKFVAADLDAVFS